MNNTKINPLYNTSKEFRHLVSDLDHNVNTLLTKVKTILDTCDETTLSHINEHIENFTKCLDDYETDDTISD